MSEQNKTVVRRIVGEPLSFISISIRTSFENPTGACAVDKRDSTGQDLPKFELFSFVVFA